MGLETGSKFGDYLLGAKLGQGGYGIVYSARDTKLDREIAVKILKAEQLARPQVVKRFLQEARSAAKIVHPGIVTVYECGHVKDTKTPDDGTVYIAMEILQGEPLGKRLKRGRLSVAQAIDVCLQVASALEAAHDKGIVHRDLKPDNLHLVPDASLPGGERVKVLDFGIAKLADADDITSVHTSSMMMMGTPKYMSPEQCRSTAQVDHRTDIYSLGCILFELLTARTPYLGDAGEQIAKHQLEATPSTRALAPEVPKALDRLVVRMLSKKPDDRPSTMAKVQDALRALAQPSEDQPTNRDDENHSADRAVTDRAKTYADGPLSKRVTGVLKLEAAMRDVMEAREHGVDTEPGPSQVDATQVDMTQRDGVPVLAREDVKTTPDPTQSGEPPRLTTNPERAATKAQSLDMMRMPWWRRPKVVVAAGGATVAIVVAVMLLTKGARDVPAVSPPVASLQPAAAAPAPEPRTVAPAYVTSCDGHATARAWDELMACADRLADPQAARTARTQAVLELRNRGNVAKLEQALTAKDHTQALMWLERVDDTSVYRSEAVAAFAAALPKPEAAAGATCNGAKLAASAKTKLGAGQYRDALADIEASLRCTPDPNLYRLGALAACNGRNPAKARMFASRLPAGQLTTIRQICLRNGVELP